MPVEIRELVIKVTVNQPSQGQQPSAVPAMGAKADDDKEAIISQCVDEILGIIENKKER
ncbi:hypothetical protein Niako_0467 [Niastella koreensis GR20-10]|jgi:hypothetical protein|uniref:Uncharacterized protein n=1 Tax=Niastella koreensis (strain DSM 17620 / KACC 11465 / NBRC 106392 / GR20-10) TaxID=700598 RepID=G8T6M0_NIAKG|nr:DUF5908 family protein [Niastella koreensis]AEV96865.1 hypothetical protein Niako_0467 [Niastella koreensis GR20-10]